MQVNSSIVGQVQASLGQAAGGLEMPELLLPVLALRIPVDQFSFNVAPDLTSKPGSAAVTISNFQPASTAAGSVNVATLDRGLYRLRGFLVTLNISGPAPTSGNPRCAALRMFNPNPVGNGYVTLAETFLRADVAQSISFDYVFHLSRAGSLIQLQNLQNTGVGEAITSECTVSIERLL